ncbi:MAG: hypothetical protein JWN48_3647 [Myxococcaceae bacterium]|nr:hypothetical protein [Myxococcaceae bacterium]
MVAHLNASRDAVTLARPAARSHRRLPLTKPIVGSALDRALSRHMSHEPQSPDRVHARRTTRTTGRCQARVPERRAQTHEHLKTQRTGKPVTLPTRTVTDLPAPSMMAEPSTPQNAARK